MGPDVLLYPLGESVFFQNLDSIKPYTHRVWPCYTDFDPWSGKIVQGTNPFRVSPGDIDGWNEIGNNLLGLP